MTVADAIRPGGTRSGETRDLEIGTSKPRISNLDPRPNMDTWVVPVGQEDPPET